jgi:hypothetical protein
MIYLHMLENWFMPHLNEDSNDYRFQQDGSPAHYHKDVRGYLNRNLPQSWIRRKGKDDALMRWPLRYPDLTPATFFSGDLWRTSSLCLHSPLSSRISCNRIIAAVALDDRDTLTRVWNEMDCRIDVCRITKGGHIEHLWNMQNKSLESFSLYRRKNYHDPLRSLFVANF